MRSPLFSRLGPTLDLNQSPTLARVPTVAIIFAPGPRGTHVQGCQASTQAHRSILFRSRSHLRSGLWNPWGPLLTLAPALDAILRKSQRFLRTWTPKLLLHAERGSLGKGCHLYRARTFIPSGDPRRGNAVQCAKLDELSCCYYVSRETVKFP